MKYLIVLFLFLFVHCSSTEKRIEYKPSVESGCANISVTKDRLNCISKMIKTLEGIRNAKISVTSVDGERYDSEFVNTVETYCFTNVDESEKYLCFDAQVLKYDPTIMGKIKSFVFKFGLGFTFGIVTGMYVGG